MIDKYSQLNTSRLELGRAANGGDLVVKEGGEEVGVLVANNLGLEVSGGLSKLVAGLGVLDELVGLLVEELDGVVLGDLLALSGGDGVLDPLVELRSRNLGGGSILHQVVDGDTTKTSEPGLHVAKTDEQVLSDTLLGDLTALNVRVDKVSSSDVDILSSSVDLVRSGHVLVEDLGGDDGKLGVSNPGTVVASGDLSELVLVDTLHGDLVGGGVVLDGDLSSHTSHGVDASLVAGLDEQLDVRRHVGDGHGDVSTVGQNKLGVVLELLDEGEDVVPSATVKTGGVLSELVDDLVHLEGSENRLDKNGSSDGSSGHADPVLRELENVVPQTGLEVRLHLGEVEVRAGASGNGLLGVVEEVETEIKQTSGDGLAINEEVGLIEVPASRSDDKGGELLLVGSQLVRLSTGLLVGDGSSDTVVEVDLTVDHVGPGGGGRVLEVGHVGPDIRVQGVDDHLSVSGAGDLNSSVNKTGSRGGSLPSGVLSDVLGLGEEVGELAGVDSSLSSNSSSKELVSSGIEGSVQGGDESKSLLGEDVLGVGGDVSPDLNTLENGVSVAGRNSSH